MMIRMETMTINSRPWRRGSRAASPTSKRPEAVVVERRGGRDREIRVVAYVLCPLVGLLSRRRGWHGMACRDTRGVGEADGGRR